MASDLIRVGHFGVHWASGGIAFLEQGSTSTTAVGVEVPTPFEVKPVKRGAVCPHLINLSEARLSDEEWGCMVPLLDDPLVDALLPLPRTDDNRCFYFTDSEHRLMPLVMTLTRMSCPVRPIITPIWSGAADIHLTNVAPIVITDAVPARTKLISSFISSARIGVRTVVMIGEPDVVLNRDFERRQSTLGDMPIEQLRDLPWERFGAHLLRRYMRGEPIPGQIRRSLVSHS